MAEAATFTRDSLATYEKGPQKPVSDKLNPFRGANAARQATGADIANAGALSREGEPSRIHDIAPSGNPVARGAAASDDAPVVDEDGTLGDPTDSGEGTSDDLTSDSSTDTVDHGDEADTVSDLTAAPAEEEVEDEPAKGSARERIVELNDKLEGAMVFGKTVQEAYKSVVEENARLKAGLSPAAAAPAATGTPPVVNDNPGPMPDMSDPDVNFDNDKYRAKMQEWSTKNAQHAARQVVRELTGVAQANTLMQQVNEKAEAYTREHPEFTEVVTNNPVLKANQLAPDAGLLVARSPYMADLLMRFGNDPGFAIRAARMHPVDQIALIGEMVAEIKAEKKAAGTSKTTTTPTKQTQTATRTGAQPGARKSVSQAPPPPTRVGGGGASKRFDPLDPNTSMDDVVREHRAEKERARKESRRLRGLS